MKAAKKNVGSDSSDCYKYFLLSTCNFPFSMQIFQRVLNYKFELISFWQSFSMFCPEMWHHLLDSPVITTYDQLTNFLFLCIWKRIVRKLRIFFSDTKESEFQLILVVCTNLWICYLNYKLIIINYKYFRIVTPELLS